MHADDWVALDAIINEALDLPAQERAAFLHARLADRPAEFARAQRIFEQFAEAETFLEPADPRPTADPAETPSRIGIWSIGEVLGKGGMGTVYAARRVEGGFDQTGALKLMRQDAANDVARFETERQLLARLDHTGIARLLDGGVSAEGRPWMVMERVEGAPIDQWCRERGSSLADRIALALDMLDAVGAAHRILVLHRDLKPGNVLVDGSGRVRVIDFGIAKRMDGSDQTQDILPLSAPYAAPELLTGAPLGPPGRCLWRCRRSL